MTKPPKPDTPHRVKLQFRKRHGTNPARELVLVMQRLVARICDVFPQAVVKGGLGLELRLDMPRTTKDADIIIAASHDLDARLTEAGRLDLGDFMRFRITPDKGGAEFMVPGMPYPARRYSVQAFFTDTDPQLLPAQKPYRTFKLEVSIREAAEQPRHVPPTRPVGYLPMCIDRSFNRQVRRTGAAICPRANVCETQGRRQGRESP